MVCEQLYEEHGTSMEGKFVANHVNVLSVLNLKQHDINDDREMVKGVYSIMSPVSRKHQIYLAFPYHPYSMCQCPS